MRTFKNWCFKTCAINRKLCSFGDTFNKVNSNRVQVLELLVLNDKSMRGKKSKRATLFRSSFRNFAPIHHHCIACCDVRAARRVIVNSISSKSGEDRGAIEGACKHDMFASATLTNQPCTNVK